MNAEKRILFFCPFGAWSVHNQFDAVLATALRQRGCEVAVARCDGLFQTCDVLARAGSPERRCARCAATGKKFFAGLDLPVLQLREFLTPADFAEAQRWADAAPESRLADVEYRGLPLGEWATSSVFSYFRITAAGLARPEVRRAHRGFLVTAWLTYRALEGLTAKFKPANLCVFNGRMATYRVALEFAKRHGLPVITHERGVADDSFIVYEGENCLATRPVHECAQLWQDVPLTRAECEKTREYLASREGGKGMNFPSFYGYRTEYAGVRRMLRIPEHAKVLAVLTSSEFEQAYGHTPKGDTNEAPPDHSGQMEALAQLIEVFRGREEYLVVRHHPFIAGMKDQPPDRHFIAQAYAQAVRASDNVRVIMPSEE